MLEQPKPQTLNPKPNKRNGFLHKTPAALPLPNPAAIALERARILRALDFTEFASIRGSGFRDTHPHVA